MNTEEHFIERIVAVPADEAGRRAYADWLRQQGDSRADYLLAEMVWAETRAGETRAGETRDGETRDGETRAGETRDGETRDGETRDGETRDGDAEARLRAMAVQAGATWAARVSRPPLGVCADHVRFGDGAGGLERPKLSDHHLDWIEARFRLTLPADYRAFLLNHNGGIPEPAHFRIPGRVYDHGCFDELGTFISVWAAEESKRDWDLDLVWQLQFLDEVRCNPEVYRDETHRWRGKPHANLMVIGYGPAYDELAWLCLGCRGDELGKVYCVAPFLMAGFPDYCLAAPSFAEFIGLLRQK